MKLFFKIFTLLVALSATQGLSAQDISNTEIRQILRQQKIGVQDLNTYLISSSHVSSTSGLTHVYLQQRYQGIPIHNAMMGIHLTPDKKVFKLNNQFIRNPEKHANRTQPSLSAIAAVKAAARAMSYEITSPLSLTESRGGTAQEVVLSKSGISQRAIPVKLTYQPMKDGRLQLCWDMSILEMDGQNWWSMRVDAHTGEIVHKNNWMLHCNFGTGDMDDNCESENTHRHTAACLEHHHEVAPSSVSEARNPDAYRVYPMPIESPNHGARQLVVNPADANASPFGWHDTNGVAGAEHTITRGNNVLAHEDLNGNNGIGFSPDAGASLDFDYGLDFGQSIVTSPNQESAITNLFYWNNIMHDVWFQYGFDEASGNFQEMNYSGLGAGNDYVIADAQDGSGENNANFGTPGDGGNPQMQMFLWGITNISDFTVNSPAVVAGNYNMAVASFGAATFDVTGDVIIVDDGSANPTEACNALVNGAAINNNIALLDRGTCEFGLKALNAQNAGAIAVIVCNNNTDAPFQMGPGADGANVTIPAVMISQADCALIRAEIPTVNVRLVNSINGRDGDFDNGIIAHEYGHGISTRLTGGAANSGCLGNDEQMGEGWSDWFGLMLTIEPGDVATDNRGIGTYAIGQNVNGNGIRSFPYSTDTNVNPHTYADIASESIPHGVGSVWCAMLWDLSWALIDQYGYDPDVYYGTGGNNIAMGLVIEGLKMQPCSPGFVDGRDAILAADEVLNGGANKCLIWEVFAARGLGFSASQGSSANVNDAVEGYDMPPACILDFTKTANVTEVVPGEEITYSFSATNLTTGTTINNIVICDDLPANTTYVAASASDGGSESGGAVVFPSVSLSPGQSITRSFTVLVDPNLDASPFDISDDVEDAAASNMIWNPSSTSPGTGTWEITTANSNGGANSWFAADYDSPNEEYLTLADISLPTAGSMMSFWHSFDTEVNWDGGKIQISTDNGFSWSDLGPNIVPTTYTYNDFTDNAPANAAFSGNSGGYQYTEVDLSPYAGQFVSIRFWMHCDAAVGGVGWYVDDINITSLGLAIPNTAKITSDQVNYSVQLANPTIINPATCTDNVLNGDETDIDCGGTTCIACPTCDDGIMNGDETDIDCGGTACIACPTCDDGILNGDETDIDCGGTDCIACPTCDDGILNGDETGIDCGGTDCIACPTCDDGILNGDETGVDCGGSTCPSCCPINDYITGTVVSGTYAVNILISSNGLVKMDSVVNYHGACIELQEGFEVELGAEFSAIINPCTPFAPEGENDSALTTENDARLLIEEESGIINIYYTLSQNTKRSIYLQKVDASVQVAIDFETATQNAGTHLVEVNKKDLPKGVYLVVLNIDGVEVVQKFIVK